jgi:hypothetical protein
MINHVKQKLTNLLNNNLDPSQISILIGSDVQVVILRIKPLEMP